MDAPAEPNVKTFDLFVGPQQLPGVLSIANRAAGVVVFALGGGNSRFSPRNQLVAHHRQANGFARLLFDRLHETESAQLQN